MKTSQGKAEKEIQDSRKRLRRAVYSAVLYRVRYFLAVSHVLFGHSELDRLRRVQPLFLVYRLRKFRMADIAGAVLAVVLEHGHYLLHELCTANGVCFDFCGDVYDENVQNEM